MPILQSSTKDRHTVSRPRRGGWLGVVFALSLLLPQGSMAQIQSIYDLESGAAPAGSKDIALSLKATHVQGMDVFGLSVLFYPEGILENVRLERGTETETFETWTVNASAGSMELEASTESGGIDMPMGQTSEVARLVFDVQTDAVEGTTVTLAIDRVYDSLPFEIATDLAVFRVGAGPVTDASRLLECEFQPDHAFPGDLIHLIVYTHDTPNLYSAQVVLEYPDGALIREGTIGGDLVEELGWSAAFVAGESSGEGPSVIVDRLFGQHPAPPPGRFQIASIPFRVGKDWGGSTEGFEVRVSRAILQGDILARGDNLYHFRNEAQTLVQSPPDLNDDGVVNHLDLIEFQKNWKEGEPRE